MSPAKQQGRIAIKRGKWAFRWRESTMTPTGWKREQKFRVLREVSAADRRRKVNKGGTIDPDRPEGGQLSTPEDIARLAKQIIEKANKPGVNALQTIGELVEMYLADLGNNIKASTLDSYKHLWALYLEGRIGNEIVIEFDRQKAYDLWKAILKHNDLSRGTMSHVRFFISGAFRWASDRGYFKGENPGAASLPKGLPRKVRPTEAYSMDELNIMLTVFPDPMAQAINALAFGSAMRKGELAAVRWEDMGRLPDGSAKIQVRRSVWQGRMTTPKTESSLADVEVAPEFMAYVDVWRELCGNPDEGFVFPGSDLCAQCRKPATAHAEADHRYQSTIHPINLDSFARWKLKPLMSRCEHCKQPKKAHAKKAHVKDACRTYKRDESIPAWKGWHAYRRGAAVAMARAVSQGDGLAAAAVALRHSDEAVTDRHYNLISGQEKRAQRAGREIATEEKKRTAAKALGAGMRKKEPIQ